MSFPYDELVNAMSDLNEDKVQELLKTYISNAPAENPMSVIDAMNAGMQAIGQRFNCFEYFVGDLIYAGEIYTQALNQLRPILMHNSPHSESDNNKVILCTVEGDLHDIGKNIVK